MPNMNLFKNTRLIFFILVSLSFSVSSQNNLKDPSLNGKNIIYVYGGMKGHSPKESVNLFVPILEKEGANVKVFDSFSVYEDEKLMNEADLIIQIFTDAFTSDPRMNNEQFKGLQNALINGTGFAGWHGGLGDSSPNPLYHFIVGGDFVSHPGELKEMKTAKYEVKIYDSEDYITNGISDFKIFGSEQYYMMIDPNVKVLAVSEFKLNNWPTNENEIKGSFMPVIWKKNYGKGRVFYSSIGHYLREFEIPEVLTMQMRGFRWASEGKYHLKENLISPVYKK
jgi:type 1 glutamine amidotransferase